MKQSPSESIRIPIRATYTVDRKTGEIVARQLEYEDFPTVAVAEFLLSRFGLDPDDLRKPDPATPGKKNLPQVGENTEAEGTLSNSCREF